MKWKLFPKSWSKKNELKENQNENIEVYKSNKDKYLSTRDFFESFQKQIDEFFQEFMYPEFFSKEKTFYPKIDITEKEKEIIIKADVPGINEKDLDVSITKDSVIIQGEKKYEHEEKNVNFYRKERTYGSFRRVIPLPMEIDESKAEATYKNGVITIKLPKSESSLKNIKKIPIKISK